MSGNKGVTWANNKGLPLTRSRVVPKIGRTPVKPNPANRNNRSTIPVSAGPNIHIAGLTAGLAAINPFAEEFDPYASASASASAPAPAAAAPPPIVIPQELSRMRFGNNMAAEDLDFNMSPAPASEELGKKRTRPKGPVNRRSRKSRKTRRSRRNNKSRKSRKSRRNSNRKI